MLPVEGRRIVDRIETKIYSLISSSDGIKAREIGKKSGQTRYTINHYLYGSPYMKELCYCDKEYRWHGLIRQSVPHQGIGEFSGYYSWVNEFLDTDLEEFLERLKEGCRNIGRNLNDKRGLFHSFEDTYYSMQNLFASLSHRGADHSLWEKWEIIFELRIKRAKTIRIYADVILITEGKIFTLEFKMKNSYAEEDVLQAVKYCEYLEVLFGEKYDVIPALVLTAAEDTYEDIQIEGTTSMVPVCSSDRLYSLIAEYCGL